MTLFCKIWLSQTNFKNMFRLQCRNYHSSLFFWIGVEVGSWTAATPCYILTPPIIIIPLSTPVSLGNISSMFWYVWFCHNEDHLLSCSHARIRSFSGRVLVSRCVHVCESHIKWLWQFWTSCELWCNLLLLEVTDNCMILSSPTLTSSITRVCTLLFAGHKWYT